MTCLGLHPFIYLEVFFFVVFVWFFFLKQWSSVYTIQKSYAADLWIFMCTQDEGVVRCQRGFATRPLLSSLHPAVFRIKAVFVFFYCVPLVVLDRLKLL